MIAADRPGIEGLLTPEGRQRWDSLQEVVAGYRPEPKITRDFWTTHDALGHEPYARAIAGFIRHRDTRPPLTIGIAAAWGAGKTSVMRMVREELDPDGQRQEIRLTEATRGKLLGGQRLHGKQPPAPEVTHGRLLAEANSPTHLDDRTIKDMQVTPVAEGRDSTVPREQETPEALRRKAWRPTVWFNPWMYESGEQVWAGLAHEIISQLTERMDRVERENFWLQLNLRRIDGQVIRRRVYAALLERLVPLLILTGILLLIAAGVVLLGFVKVAGLLVSLGGLGVAAAAVLRTVMFFSQKASTSFASLLSPPSSAKASAVDGKAGSVGFGAVRDPDYESRLGFLYLVQTDMKAVLDLVATPERPLIVFVDDLDRCSPAAVAQVVEAINLFLAGEFPNCIFVIALEPGVVATHIEVAYKDLVEGLMKHQSDDAWATLGWRFLDKIVQLPLRLPSVSSPGQLATYLDSLLTPQGSIRALRSIDAISQSQSGSSPSASGTAPVTGDPAQGGQAGPPPGTSEWDDLVRRLADAVRRRHPAIDEITAHTRLVQSEVLGIPADAPLQAAAREAARRIFDELFRDNNSEVKLVIATGVGRLPQQNPREIKRFVNLFRFYSVISAERSFAGASAPDMDQAAKLAGLAIRWPQLLNVLSKPAEGGNWLGRLETAAHRSDLPPESRDSWEQLTVSSGLSQQWRSSSAAPSGPSFEDLHQFLASDPPIGRAAEGML